MTTSSDIIRPERLSRAVAPANIWQDPYESPSALRRAAQRLDPEDESADIFLEEYCLSVRYAPRIQEDLLLAALPNCLNFWQDCLFTGRHLAVASSLHSTLYRRADDVEFILKNKADDVKNFMEQSMRARMALELRIAPTPGDPSPYIIHAFLMSYCCIFPRFELFARKWLTLTDTGSAISLFRFLSLLVYDDRDNPGYCQRTAEKLGNPPRYWTYLSDDGEREAWLPDNVESMISVFSFERIVFESNRIFEVLEAHPDQALARSLRDDIVIQEEIVRCRLREFSSLVQERSPFKDWSC